MPFPIKVSKKWLQKAIATPRTMPTGHTLSFPLDMLRYDNCWPADTESVDAIAQSLERDIDNDEHRVVVELYQYTETKAHQFHPERWASFGWKLKVYLA